MLELINIDKTYKPKKGQPVHALKQISTTFGDTGLVFILGKSGCGKSTLLNVIGGLDSFDSGEIIIKGKSSKEFSQSDFDSYRNTLVGFIFQEYNILDDFNVEKNIALALELQGKKAEHNTVLNILKEVGLEEQAKRKTTELSGGQKQRIAIARALIKDPEIIIADEPTGALDSATGIQVFDTLKELAKKRLVIVVSHDREFAERYGDRVIVMVDGKISSDETKRYIQPKEISDGFNIVGNDTIHIEKNHKLNMEESKAILNMIAHSSDDIMISTNPKSNKELRKIIKVDDSGVSERFEKSSSEDLAIKSYDGKKLKLIKSKLKFKDSFKMGASGLKAKPIRLVFTIFLCFIAFAMFGLTDTLGSYNKRKTTAQSVIDSSIKNLSFIRHKRSQQGDNAYYNETKMRAEDIDELSKKTGLDFKPVFTGDYEYISLNNAFEKTSKLGSQYDGFYKQQFSGLTYMSREEAVSLGFNITGTDWATGSDDIVITKYMYDHFKLAGYIDPVTSTTTKAENISEQFLIGKKINLNNKNYTIKAIVDTKLDEERYSMLKQDKSSNESKNSGTSIVDYITIQEFNYVIKYGYHALGFVTKTEFNEISKPVQAMGVDINSLYSIEFNSSELRANDRYTKIFDVKDLAMLKYRQGASSIGANQIVLNVIDALDKISSGVYSDVNKFSQYQSLVENYENSRRDAIALYVENLSAGSQELQNFYNSRSNSNQEKSEYEFFLNNQYDDPGYFNNPYGKSGYSITSKWIFDNILSNNQYVNLMVQFFKTYYNQTTYDSNDYQDRVTEEADVVGFFAPNDQMIKSDNGYYTQVFGVAVNQDLYDRLYAESNMIGSYGFAITQMPESNSKVSLVVDYYYDQDANDDLAYKMLMINEVTFIMNNVSSLIETLSQVFLYVGIGFAVFASLMMMAFISTSISYKKREIGILRAVGARSKDVFGIFFNESLIIAFINFLLATAGSMVVTFIINNLLRNEYGLKITLLNFGIRQIALILIVSIAVAFISSALPVFRIAKKKPIDAINNR